MEEAATEPGEGGILEHEPCQATITPAPTSDGGAGFRESTHQFNGLKQSDQDAGEDVCHILSDRDRQS